MTENELIRQDVFSYLIGCDHNSFEFPYLRWDREKKGFYRIFFDGYNILVGFEAYSNLETAKKTAKSVGCKIHSFKMVDDPRKIKEAYKKACEIVRIWKTFPNDRKDVKPYEPYRYYVVSEVIKDPLGIDSNHNRKLIEIKNKIERVSFYPDRVTKWMVEYYYPDQEFRFVVEGPKEIMTKTLSTYRIGNEPINLEIFKAIKWIRKCYRSVEKDM